MPKWRVLGKPAQNPITIKPWLFSTVKMRGNSKSTNWVSFYISVPEANKMPSVLMPVVRMILALKRKSNTRPMIQIVGFYINFYSLCIIRAQYHKSQCLVVISLIGKCPGNLGEDLFQRCRHTSTEISRELSAGAGHQP